MFSDGTIETLAIRCALGNNGGEWATHYTDEQKEHWRSFARDLLDEASRAWRDDMLELLSLIERGSMSFVIAKDVVNLMHDDRVRLHPLIDLRGLH